MLKDGEFATVEVVYNYFRNPDYKQGSTDSFYFSGLVQAEVLTVHFAKRTMRVRFNVDGKAMTIDVDATPFFEKYQLIER
jgi:hypothetical protein